MTLATVNVSESKEVRMLQQGTNDHRRKAYRFVLIAFFLFREFRTFWVSGSSFLVPAQNSDPSAVVVFLQHTWAPCRSRSSSTQAGRRQISRSTYPPHANALSLSLDGSTLEPTTCTQHLHDQPITNSDPDQPPRHVSARATNAASVNYVDSDDDLEV